MITLAASQAFHRTLYVRDQETTTEVLREQEKLKHLIRRLKIKTGVHKNT
jgi:hypothetical protein